MRTRKQPIEQAISADPEQARVGETVLLVDDEDGVREPASEHLRGLGYRVFEAADGATALRMLDTIARLDLLVTDVGLPNGMNGRQVAEAVRQHRPSPHFSPNQVHRGEESERIVLQSRFLSIR